MTRRRPDAGITLVEVLVVLVLVGVLTGAVSLSIGAGNRSTALDRETDLLVARLNRAADELALSGQPMSFAWSEDEYTFRVAQDGAWVPHGVDLLRAPHALPDPLRFDGLTGRAGAIAVGADMIPSSGQAETWTLTAEAGSTATVRFDGITATRTDAQP